MHDCSGKQTSENSLWKLFNSVQSLSHVRLCGSHGLKHASLPCSSPTPRVYSNSCPSSGDVTQPYHHLLSPSSPASIFSIIRVFSKVSVLHIRWPKYWSFRFSISPSNEYSGLVRTDWLDLLEVQRTGKSLLQHHSSKSSIHWYSVFVIVQLSIHTRLLEKP